MLRVTQDVLEIRRWVEARGARPCRDGSSGRLGVAFEGDPCPFPVGWDEFEPAFCAAGCVCVYDDAPGACRLFVGEAGEVHEYVARWCGEVINRPPAPAPPHG